MVGTVLKDRYEIVAEQGKGGMSTVYLARDSNLGSYWAVKQVKNTSHVDITAFKKEVELLSGLNHSDIPRIVDKIEINDDYFVVMDFINGITLKKKVSTEGSLPESDVVTWAKMLCEVLIYLHTVKENPIVYRDMKPDNIMLTESGRIKLIDFGIAKECRRGEVQNSGNIGTKGYAAPEQYKGASNIFDERTDIYGLGATLFFLVTGQVPGKPPNAVEPVRQVNPTLSEGLEYIIDKCMRNNPDERYNNCEELLADLIDIDLLTSKYRRVIRKRLMRFVCSFSLCIIFAVTALVGYSGRESERRDNFQIAWENAIVYRNQAVIYRENDDGSGANTALRRAGEELRVAISNQPSEVRAYLMLFDILLPHNDAVDHVGETQRAIETIRAFVDNPASPIHNNAEILHRLVISSLDYRFTDGAFARYALTYIETIKQSTDYINGSYSFRNEIDNLGVLAMFLSEGRAMQDFPTLNAALLDLEYNTTQSLALSPDDRLNNYYVIIGIYSRYPNDLENAHYNINRIGRLAKDIIDINAASETLEFSNIIPMYEIIATTLYDRGVVVSDVEQRYQYFRESLEWFGFLEDLSADLSEPVEMKRANAHRALFETYTSIEGQDNIDSRILSYLARAQEIYYEILQRNPENFIAQVNVTLAYLQGELIRPSDERNFANAMSAYERVLVMRNENRNLTTAQLTLFSSLRQQMINAGLEA
ncbi:MAG: serine/threonine protein kinase [Oscillospiraceae bacterium]|nr:serine/threonine protein kinase [Oscillospiraceae bacterium]